MSVNTRNETSLKKLLSFWFSTDKKHLEKRKRRILETYHYSYPRNSTDTTHSTQTTISNPTFSKAFFHLHFAWFQVHHYHLKAWWLHSPRSMTWTHYLAFLGLLPSSVRSARSARSLLVMSKVSFRDNDKKDKYDLSSRKKRDILDTRYDASTAGNWTIDFANLARCTSQFIRTAHKKLSNMICWNGKHWKAMNASCGGGCIAFLGWKMSWLEWSARLHVT